MIPHSEEIVLREVAIPNEVVILNAVKDPCFSFAVVLAVACSFVVANSAPILVLTITK
jgi:hypothetical protein